MNAIELVEGEDILEAGILIISQPPGKKLQNMMQLSGGEKALTAIALLFAIQNLKPSPFCLLDELEAALDDSNVGRNNSADQRNQIIGIKPFCRKNIDFQGQGTHHRRISARII